MCVLRILVTRLYQLYTGTESSWRIQPGLTEKLEAVMRIKHPNRLGMILHFFLLMEE